MFRKKNMLKNEEGTILIVFIIILGILSSILVYSASASLSNKVGIEGNYGKSVAINIADAGAEKAIWELQQGHTYTGETANSSVSGGQFDVTMSGSGNERYITSIAYVPLKATPKFKKAIKVKVSTQDSTSGPYAFNYGAQVGALGLVMSNNSMITGTGGAKGNVYSAGSIQGSNGSEITGDAFVSGATNEIEGVKIDHDAHAHRIESSSILHDAFYNTITGTTVGGTKHPGSADPLPVALPITTDMINSWKTNAEAGGTLGSQTITNHGSGTLGPVKINGNLTVDNGGTLTIKGTLWVTGTINFSNGAIIKLDSSYGANSGLIIADGKVNISNNVVMSGSGNSKSFIMAISLDGGSTVGNPAINAANNSTAVVYYAPNGMIEISNNAHLKAVTGKGLDLSNGAQVQYDSGLASTEFYEGPGGTWAVSEWQEITPP